MKRLLLSLCLLPLLTMAQTPLPTSWNFSSPGIASPPTGWVVNNELPASTGGRTYSFGKGDGLSCRFDAQGENLVINFADKPGNLSFYLSPQNAGNPWSGKFDAQESADGTNWVDIYTITSKPTTATGFTDPIVVRPLDPSSRWVRFILSTKTAGNMALDSVMIQAAPAPPTATINIKQGSTTIVNNTTYVVGTTTSTVFTIENKGTAEALNITNSTITGNNAQDFNVTNMPTTIAPNSSATFTLDFSPADVGTHTAALTITSNDVDKTNYTINLYGIGSSNLATEPASQASQFTFSDMTAYGFKINFKPTNDAEYYVVMRKNGAPVNEFPVDGQTYKRGDYIGQNQVLYVGKDSTYKPPYILANSTYHFAVFAANGPQGYENYRTSDLLRGTTTTPGSNPGSYYNGINSGAANFVTSLSALTNPHDTVFYSQYISTLVNNFLTRDTTNGKKVVNCVYTTLPYLYEEPFVWWTGGNSGKLTREHTFPQSWMPSNQGGGWPNDPVTGKELPEYNDLHHLFPADQLEGNGPRSNHPYGVVVTVTDPSPTGKGKLGTDAQGRTVYEPNDEHKGDAARAIFYMTVAYNGIGGRNWSLGAVNSGNQTDSILKAWHFQDLPDALEIARHEYIASVQHNRNPFIDSINYACRINFNNLSWISNPGNCGVTVPSLTLTSPVGGEEWNITMPGVGGNVSWVAAHIDSVNIQLLIEDTLWANAGTVAASLGSKEIMILPTPPSTTKAKIKLTANNGTLISISPDYFTIRSYLGIKNVLPSSALSVFPNPSKGLVTVQLNDGAVGQGKLYVTDIAGRVITQKSFQQQTTLDGLHSGIYFIKVETSTGSVVKKLIIE